MQQKDVNRRLLDGLKGAAKKMQSLEDRISKQEQDLRKAKNTNAQLRRDLDAQGKTTNALLLAISELTAATLSEDHTTRTMIREIMGDAAPIPAEGSTTE